jgi:YesN/AraC family two-component response regulator
MKTVLVIDDEERMRNIYKGLFKAFPGRVAKIVEAPNAIEAANALAREKVDLVLLDIIMPGVNGQTLFEIIEEYSSDIDVIIASVFPIDQQKKLLPRAKDYYDKSQGPRILLDKLTRFC